MGMQMCAFASFHTQCEVRFRLSFVFMNNFRNYLIFYIMTSLLNRLTCALKQITRFRFMVRKSKVYVKYNK